jgi:2-polyprenyl-6-methoxyphenol hydroxylase-like FAD-dependent oxidoreductase
MSAGANTGTLRAIVIGGSISGLFAANLLRLKGWNVEVYERSDVELRGRGAGIVSHRELLNILTESGAGTENLGIHVEHRVLFDRPGNVIGRFEYPQIVTSWDRLQNLCRDLQPPGRYHLAHNCVGFDQDADGVTVHFEGGQSTRGDLLVGADGFRSVVRKILAPQVQPLYAGYVIWRALVDESELDAQTHAAVFENFTFFLAPGHEVIGYPIAGSNNDLTPGKRRYNLVWYRTIDDARLLDMLTDSTGHIHAVSIPPPLVREDVVREMRTTAEGFMCEPLLKVLRAIETAFFTPIYDLASPSMISSRVALIGDAAFVARPHVGLGVTKGASDAKALADSLAAYGNDIDAGLKCFNEKRKAVGDKVVARGRELGAFLNQNLPSDEIDEKHRQDLLRNTAADDFLHR